LTQTGDGVLKLRKTGDLRLAYAQLMPTAQIARFDQPDAAAAARADTKDRAAGGAVQDGPTDLIRFD
jgi:hypothetical protein